MGSSKMSTEREPAKKLKGEPTGEGATIPSLRRPARAELIWEGKYDADGRRVAPLRVALPFQTVETVNESAQDRQRGFLFGPGFREEEWRNRLIWGDKKYVLPSLLAQFAGKVNLIYIDPPFDTGADFSFTATVPEYSDEAAEDSYTFTKEPSIIEHKAYRDTWGRGLESYLQWFCETAAWLYELLHETGSLYVHLDYHVSHYAKAVLDEIFGPNNFRNEIVWQRTTPKGHAFTRFPSTHDVLLYYGRSEEVTWHPQYIPHRAEYIESHYSNVEPATGRRYMLDNCLNPNPDRPNLKYEWKGHIRVWRWTKEKMQGLHDEGRIVYTKSGMPRYKRYLDEMPGVPLHDIWTDISPVNSQALEATQYATQSRRHC
jgi:adenine specific DNA methylase Mod